MPSGISFQSHSIQDTEHSHASEGPADAAQYRNLHGEIIYDESHFEALAKDWERLRRTGRRPEIFGSLAFVRAWWRAFGHDRRLCIVVVFNGARPVAILPLASRGRTIRFIGTPGADYNDLLAPAAAPAEVLAEGLRTLARCDFGWDLAIFDDVAEDSNFVALSRDLSVELRSRLILTRRTVCPTLLLNTAGISRLDAILNRADSRRDLKRLAQAGELRIRHLKEAEEIHRHLPIFFRQHMQRWALVGVKSQFVNSAPRVFLKALLDELGPERARFSVLEQCNLPLAYHFGFEADGKFIYYTPTFDVDRLEKSPGKALLLLLLSDARRRGLREFDLGTGDEPYKSHFSNAVRTNLTFILPRSRWHVAPARVRSFAMSHPGIWQGLKSAQRKAEQSAARLRLALRRDGLHRALARIAYAGVRTVFAKDEIWVFRGDLQRREGRQPDNQAVGSLQIHEGTLSALAEFACRDLEFDAAWLRGCRDRLKAGEQLFLAKAGETIAHIAWVSAGAKVTTLIEWGTCCRFATGAPIAVIHGNSLERRGCPGIAPELFRKLADLAPADCNAVFIFSSRGAATSLPTIENDGFRLTHRIGRICFLGRFERYRVGLESHDPSLPLLSVAQPSADT